MVLIPCLGYGRQSTDSLGRRRFDHALNSEEGDSTMPSKLRSHLTYANVVSSVCLFIVLGGTSYAVATGSIDSREIKNNTVRSKDLRNNTVRSRDVRNFSLLARDFRPGQLLRGPRGRRGPRGPRGRRGTPGENATKLFAYIRDDNPLDTHTATVHYGSGVTGVSDP